MHISASRYIAMVQRQIPGLKADFFKALGHPLRIRVLELLAEEDLPVSAMLEHVPVSQPHLSQQLAVLRRAGIVTARREGGGVVYALADPRLADLLALSRQILLDLLTASREELKAS